MAKVAVQLLSCCLYSSTYQEKDLALVHAHAPGDRAMSLFATSAARRPRRGKPDVEIIGNEESGINVGLLHAAEISTVEDEKRLGDENK